MTIKSLAVLALTIVGSTLSAQNAALAINPELETTTEKLISGFDGIPSERRAELEELGDFMFEQAQQQGTFNALFVCTHNSRRSHLADLWFKYGLYYFGLPQFESFSGGTEATAFNPKAIAAVQRAGFTVDVDPAQKNPVVSITPKKFPIWNMMSKVYTHESNPKSNFVAVMVCSDADKSCPAVDGAVGRFAIPYNDPRYFDNTPSERKKYDETVTLIGTEMLFLTSYIKDQSVAQKESAK